MGEEEVALLGPCQLFDEGFFRKIRLRKTFD